MRRFGIHLFNLVTSGLVIAAGWQVFGWLVVPIYVGGLAITVAAIWLAFNFSEIRAAQVARQIKRNRAKRCA